MRTIGPGGAVALLLLTATAAADKLPPGSLGIFTGVIAGTGADNKRIGEGLYEFGAQAAYHLPINTDGSWGLSLRWSTMFGILWNGTASHIDSSLRTVQMDFTGGLRFRPWSSARSGSYFTLRGGAELLRANEPIPNNDSMTGQRAYLGAIGLVGFDQYIFGSAALLSFDLRYGMIGGGGPQSLTFMVGIAVTGP